MTDILSFVHFVICGVGISLFIYRFFGIKSVLLVAAAISFGSELASAGHHTSDNKDVLYLYTKLDYNIVAVLGGVYAITVIPSLLNPFQFSDICVCIGATAYAFIGSPTIPWLILTFHSIDKDKLVFRKNFFTYAGALYMMIITLWGIHDLRYLDFSSVDFSSMGAIYQVFSRDPYSMEVFMQIYVASFYIIPVMIETTFTNIKNQMLVIIIKLLSCLLAFGYVFIPCFVLILA